MPAACAYKKKIKQRINDTLGRTKQQFCILCYFNMNCLNLDRYLIREYHSKNVINMQINTVSYWDYMCKEHVYK